MRLALRAMGPEPWALSLEPRTIAKNNNVLIDQLLFNINASKTARTMRIYQILPALVIQGNEPENRTIYMGKRKNSTGIAYIKQEIKRGFYEISVPFNTLAKFLSGRATLEQVTYKNKVLKESKKGQD